jgi:predicted alpha/beta-fold hydrolase
MSETASSYRSPWLLKHGHAATILTSFFPAPAAAWTSLERLELPDGDFLDLAWLQSGRSRLAILCHGLEGSLNAPYIRSMASQLHASDWDVLAWNYRGCGNTPNRLLRSYHSGESGDLRHIISNVAQRYPQIVLIGFSLGGNITLKYLGEAPSHPAVQGGIAISAPVDLASSARQLDGRRSNRLYQSRFLKTLRQKTFAKARRFPGQVDTTRLAAIRTIRGFDELVTAPWHGFTDAADYYARSSSRPFLPGITVPALLLNAQNDPLLDGPCFPAPRAIGNPYLTFEYPTAGGHLGFPDLSCGLRRWHEQRAAAFLKESGFA